MTTVLLVDDEPLVLRALSIQLRRRRPQWTVLTAESGERAIEELAVRELDVIVSDMRMPGLTGPELLEHVRQHYPHVGRIVLSGQATPEAIQRATPIAHEYLTKPLSGKELVDSIERVIAGQPRPPT
jgi:YesN/AraC family two-component response regulator